MDFLQNSEEASAVGGSLSAVEQSPGKYICENIVFCVLILENMFLVKTHLVQNSLFPSQTMLELLNLVAEIFNEFDRNLSVLFLRHSASIY